MRQVYEHVIVGLIFHHLMMLGIMGLKEFPYAALLLPLPILTIFFKIFIDRLFQRPLTLLSLRAARDLDKYDQSMEKKNSVEEREVEDASIPDSYVNECFKINWQQIDATIAKVPQIQAAIDKPYDEAVSLIDGLTIPNAAEFYSLESFALSKSALEEERTPIAGDVAEGSGADFLNKKR